MRPGYVESLQRSPSVLSDQEQRITAGTTCLGERKEGSSGCHRDEECTGQFVSRNCRGNPVFEACRPWVPLQVLLYAQKESVEPDAIKQLIHLAESPLPVSTQHAGVVCQGFALSKLCVTCAGWICQCYARCASWQGSHGAPSCSDNWQMQCMPQSCYAAANVMTSMSVSLLVVARHCSSLITVCELLTCK